MDKKDSEKNAVSISSLPALDFKGTTKKNLVPLLIDESSMCSSDKMKEYFIKTACYHEQKIDELRKQAKS